MCHYIVLLEGTPPAFAPIPEERDRDRLLVCKVRWSYVVSPMGLLFLLLFSLPWVLTLVDTPLLLGHTPPL